MGRDDRVLDAKGSQGLVRCTRLETGQAVISTCKAEGSALKHFEMGQEMMD